MIDSAGRISNAIALPWTPIRIDKLPALCYHYFQRNTVSQTFAGGAVTELPDYYAILGVPPTASRDEIRAAYRRLARRHHPDVNPRDKGNVAANEFMRQLNAAYEVLNTPRRRAAYDRQRWVQAPYRSSQAWSPSPDDTARGPQTGGSRWRPPKARRQVYDQPMPGWLKSLLAVEERLKTRLEPFSALIGVIGPVLALAALLIFGFLAYEQIQADPKAVRFLDRIISAGGGVWALCGVLGVTFLVFFGVWFAIWRAFKD
jgi:hypothetical protein